MKKAFIFMNCVFLFVLGAQYINAQEVQKDTAYLDDSEKPIIFKFEPDFLLKNKQRKIEIAGTKKMIDTLNISNRKRHKLLKDLYKNGLTKRLKNAIIADTQFDDED